MNFLKGLSCYLSGPIECEKPEDGVWRDEATSILESYGINVYDPFKDPKEAQFPALLKARQDNDYNTMAKIASSFVRKDLRMVDKCHIVASHLPYGAATAGTHHEITHSDDIKNPTLIVCPEGKSFVPFWYYGFIPHTCMFGSWKALGDYLRYIDEGGWRYNKRWAVLKDIERF